MPYTVNGVVYQYRRPLNANTVGIAASVTDVLPFVGPDLTGKALASLNDVVLTEADGTTLLGSPSANKYAGQFEVKTITAPVGHGKFTLTAGQAAYLAAYLYYNATGGDPGDQTDIATALTSLSHAGYWPLSDASSPAVDWTGNGNNGVDQGATGFGIAGQVGNAVNFTGSYPTSRLIVTDAAGLRFSTVMTVEAWVKWTVSQTNVGIVSRWQNESGAYAWVLDVSHLLSNGIAFGIAVGGALKMAGSVGTYNDGNWHHVIGVYDGTRVWLYVDGGVETIAGDLTAGPIDPAVGCNLGIGYYAGNAFNGSVDGANVGGYAASASRALARYRAGYGTLWSWGAEETAPGGLPLILGRAGRSGPSLAGLRC